MSEKKRPICRVCGGENILADAYARWNVETQEWEVESTFDKGGYCEDCDENDARMNWVIAPETPED